MRAECGRPGASGLQPKVPFPAPPRISQAPRQNNNVEISDHKDTPGFFENFAKGFEIVEASLFHKP